MNKRRTIFGKRNRTADLRRRLYRKPLTQSLEERALLAVYSVSPTVSDGAVGSLRYAIGQANSTAENDTIQLDPGTYTLGSSQDIDLNQSGYSITIEGTDAATTTINAGGGDRAFEVFTGVTAHIKGVSLTGGTGSGAGIYNKYGNLTVEDVVIDGNTAYQGAGIYVYGNGTDGSLTLINSTVSNNTSSAQGGGIYAYNADVSIQNSTIDGNQTGNYGGGIYSYKADLTLTGSNVINNTSPSSSYSGGGLEVVRGSLAVTDSVIDGNTAGRFGGGINVNATDDPSTITGTTISNNTVSNGEGAGIRLRNTELSIVQSSIIGNAANGSNGRGGGIYATTGDSLTINQSLIASNTTTGSGGGLYYYFASSAAPLTIENSTFSGNDADDYAGGLYFYAQATVAGTILNSTFVDNSASSNGGGIRVQNTFAPLNMKNSIVANNTASGSPEIEGTVTSQGYNLIEDTTGATIVGTTTGNIYSTDPQLGLLQSNGGPTHTHDPLTGSPVIDAGTTSGAPTVDQRDYTRSGTGTSVDIGAVEFQVLVEPPVAVADSYSISEDSILSVVEGSGLKSNDGGTSPTVTAWSGSSTLGAAVTVNADGSFSYDPTAVTVLQALADGSSTNDSFTYTLTNSQGTDTATVTITVNGANDAPVGADDQHGAAIYGRHVFYNNSTHDGDNSNLTVNDDFAIATDKQALLPGQTATFANYTSFEDGITGIMVDVKNPAGTLMASDFEFHVGNDNAPGGWAAAPAPVATTVRVGDGVGDSNRVSFSWNAGAISGEWLQVTVKANASTGLAVDDVFYFGNAIGDTGDSALDADVDIDDSSNLQDTIDNSFRHPFSIADRYDFDRDGDVDATDKSIATSHPASGAGALQLITPPSITTVADYITTEDANLSIVAPGVLSNDFDPDTGDTLSSVGAGSTSYGATYSFTSGGALTFDPSGSSHNSLKAREVGLDMVGYQLSDGVLGDSVTVYVAVIGLNDAPVAVNDSAAVTEGNLASGNLLTSNDSDPDGDQLMAFAQTKTSAYGMLTISTTGGYTYTPNGSLADQQIVTDAFTYTVTDGKGGTATATISITVTGANSPPEAVDDSYATNEDLAISNLAVLSNDDDPDGDPISLDSHDLVSGNQAAISVTSGTTDQLDYDPTGSNLLNSLGRSGSVTDSFTYTITDGFLTDSATVSVIVSGVNDPPIADNDGYSVGENGSLLIGSPTGMLAGDTDPDTGDTLLVVSIDTATAPTIGNVTYEADGAFTYNPNGQFETLSSGQPGTDSFTYVVSDGLATATATVTFMITGENDDPVAQADSYSLDWPTLLTVPASGVMANDYDIDQLDVLSVDVGNSDASSAMGAIVTFLADGQLSYDPSVIDMSTLPAGTYIDTFSYLLIDDQGGSSVGTVQVQLDYQPPPLVAVDDAAAANEDVVLTTGPNLLSNDLPAELPQYRSAIESLAGTSSLGATVNVYQDGTFQYDPRGVAGIEALALGETATDTFTYQTTGFGQTDTGTVTITLTGSNDIPIAFIDNLATTENLPASVVLGVLENDTDVDATDVLTVIDFDSQSAYGATVVISEQGSVIYEPRDSASIDALVAGATITDSFSYTLSDSAGEQVGGQVNVVVTGVNDPPVAVVDRFSVAASANLVISNATLASNDSDPEGDPLSVTAVTGTSKLGAIVSWDSVTGLTYDPSGTAETLGLAAGEKLVDVLSYTITDGEFPVVGEIRITVTGENDSPVAASNSYGTDEATVLTVNAPGLLSGDTDADIGEFLRTKAEVITSTLGATVEIGFDGSFVYNPLVSASIQSTPIAGVATDTFTYTVSDGSGATSTATVTVTIAGVSDSPAGNAEFDLVGGGGTSITNIDFGTTTEGAPVDVDVSITNTGDGLLELSNLVLPAGYSFVTTPQSQVVPGGEAEFTIRLDGVSQGSYSGNLTLSTNDADEGSVVIAVTGQVNVGTPAVEFALSDGTVLSSSVLDLGTTYEAIGGTLVQSLTVRNPGTADLTISSWSFGSTDFSIVGTPPSTVPAYGGEAIVQIQLDTDAASGYTDTLTVTSNAGSVPLDLVGTVLTQVDYDRWFDDRPLTEQEIVVEDADSNELRANLGVIDFGTAIETMPVTHTISIQNPGTATLTLDDQSLQLPAGFSTTSMFATTVAAGGSTQLTVQLDATTAGVYAGWLQFDSNDADEGSFGVWVQGLVVGSGVTAISLQNDTGASSSDLITSDPTLTGSVLGTVPAGGHIKLEFDHNGDGTAEHTLTPLASLDPFTYDPHSIDSSLSGALAIGYRTVVYDDQSQVVTTGQWQVIDLTIADDPDGGAIRAASVQLLNDAGATGSGAVNPTLIGEVRGNFQGGYVTVEFDHDFNGTFESPVEGSIDVNVAGGSFVYDPRTTDSNMASHTGLTSIGYRLIHKDSGGAVLQTGNWVDFSFTKGSLPYASASISSLSLLNDTGVSASDSITSDLTVTGYVSGSEYVRVEIDYAVDGVFDGTPDAFATTGRLDENSQSWFTHNPVGIDLDANQQMALRTRVVEWDTDYNEQLTSSNWTVLPSPVTYEPGAPPEIANLSLLNEPEDFTASLPVNDVRLTGAIEIESSPAPIYQVEIDVDDDEVADVTIFTDSNGNFEYLPLGLSTGSRTINARTVATEEVEGVTLTATSPWAELAFNYDGPVIPAITDLDVVSEEARLNPAELSYATLQGSIDGNDLANIRIEFDHDGDLLVDGFVRTNGSGEFSYRPAGLPVGVQVDVTARVAVWDPVAESYAYSSTWTAADSFTRVAPDNEPATVDLSLAVDTGEEDLVTTIPTIQGQVENDGEIAYVAIEIDYDNDDLNGTNASVVADASGYFSHTPSGLSPGSQTIRARVIEWDYWQGQNVDGPWTTLAFELEADTDDLPTFDRLQLWNDSGVSSTDTLTANPILEGQVANDDGVDQVRVEFHHDLGGTFDPQVGGSIDGTANVDADGRFIYDPIAIPAGTATIWARMREWSSDTNQYEYSAWSAANSVAFTMESQSEAAATMLSLELSNDTGTVALTTTDPTIRGRIANENSLAGVTIEIGVGSQTAEQFITTDQFGEFETNPAGLAYGSTTIYARTRELAQDLSYQYGSWQSLTYTYEQYVNQAATFGTLELANDTGTSDTDQITYDATISGVVDNEESLAGLVIEFDHDPNDSIDVDGYVLTGADGEFTYVPQDLPVGTVSMQARIKEYADDGSVVTSAWSAVPLAQLEATPLTVVEIDVLSLASDTGASATDKSTSVADISGTVLLPDDTTAASVEFDFDGDGEVDATSEVDVNGAFTVSPTDLDEGVQFIAARPVDNTYVEPSYGSWEVFGFVFATDPDSAAAQNLAGVLAADEATLAQAEADYESAIATARTNFLTSFKSAQDTYDTSLASAGATLSAGLVAARDTFHFGDATTTGVEQANQILTSALNTAGNDFQTNLAAFSGDTTDFDLGRFTWPAAPAANLFSLPSDSSQPRPNIDLAQVTGFPFDAFDDQQLRDDLDAAESTLRQSLETEDETLKAAIDAARAVFEAAEATAFGVFEGQVNAANDQFLVDVQGIESNTDIVTEAADHRDRVNAAKKAFQLAEQEAIEERDRTIAQANERDSRLRNLALVNRDEEYDAMPSNDGTWTLEQIYESIRLSNSALHRYEQKLNELQFELVDTISSANQLAAQKIAVARQAMEELINGSDETWRIAKANFQRDMADGEADANLDRDTAIASAEQIRAKAVGTALHAMLDTIAEKIETFNVNSEGHQATYRTAFAAAYHAAVDRYANENPGPWADQLQDQADELVEQVEDINQEQEEHATEIAAASRTQAEAIADAVKTNADTEADAAYDQSISKANALHTYRVGSNGGENTRELSAAENSRVEKNSFAEAEYDRAVSFSESLESQAIESATYERRADDLQADYNMLASNWSTYCIIGTEPECSPSQDLIRLNAEIPYQHTIGTAFSANNFEIRNYDADETYSSDTALAVNTFELDENLAEADQEKLEVDLKNAYDLAITAAETTYAAATSGASTALSAAAISAESGWQQSSNSADLALTNALNTISRSLNDSINGAARAFAAAQAAAYAAEVASWASVENTPWADYLATLAQQASENMAEFNMALNSYQQASGDAASLLANAQAGAVSAYVSSIGSAQGTLESAINGAIGSFYATIAADKTERDEQVNAETVERDKDMVDANRQLHDDRSNTALDWKQTHRGAEYEYHRDVKLANRDQSIAGAWSQYLLDIDNANSVSDATDRYNDRMVVVNQTHADDLAVALQEKTIGQAGANRWFDIDNVNAYASWVGSTSANEVAWANDTGAINVTLANNVFDALSTLADARGAAIEQYGTTLAEAARQYSITMAPANAAYQIHAGAAATNFNQDLQRLQSSAASAALAARGTYVVDSYADHLDDLENADSGADLDDFQQAAATADLARAQAVLNALQTHTSSSSIDGELLLQHASLAQNALTRSLAWADATFDTELALAEYTRSVEYARADGDLESDLIKAEGRIDVAEAGGEADYHDELAAAKATRENAEAAAEVDYVTAVADADYDLAVGSIDENDRTTAIAAADIVRDFMFGFAAESELTSRADAKITHAGSMGDAGIDYADDIGSAYTRYVATTTGAEGGYVGDLSKAANDWAGITAQAQRAYQDNVANHLHTFGDDLSETNLALEQALNQFERDFAEAAGEAEASYQYEQAQDRADALDAFSTAHPADDQAHFDAVEGQAAADWHFDLVDDYGDFIGDLAAARQTAADSGAAARRTLAQSAGDADLAFSQAASGVGESYGIGLVGQQMGYLTGSVGTENEALNAGAEAEADRMLADARAAKQYAVELATIDKEALLASFNTSSSLTYNEGVQRANAYVNRTSAEGDNFVAYATALAAAGKEYLLGQAENDRTLSDGLAGLDYDYATGMSGPAESWQNGLVTSQTAYLDSLSQAAETNRSSSTTAVNDFRSDDLAAAATAVNGMESPLGDTPWSQYQGDLADTVSTWWNTDGTAAHNTWTGEINLASDTFSTDYVNTINTQLTVASGADRLLNDNLTGSIRDLRLDLSETVEVFVQGIVNPIEAYQVAMAGASRDLQLALAEAEVLLAEGDQQGYDDAVAAANEAYDHAVNGYEDTGGNHVDGIVDIYRNAAESAGDTFRLSISNSFNDFDQTAEDHVNNWEQSLESIMEVFRDNEIGRQHDLIESTANAERDLVISQTGSLTTDLDNLAISNGSPWAERDADLAIAQEDYLEDVANAKRDRVIGESNAIETLRLAASAARRAQGDAAATARKDGFQSEATARDQREQTEATVDDRLRGPTVEAALPGAYAMEGADPDSLQELPADPGGLSFVAIAATYLWLLLDGPDTASNRGSGDMTERVNSSQASPDEDEGIPDNSYANAIGTDSAREGRSAEYLAKLAEFRQVLAEMERRRGGPVPQNQILATRRAIFFGDKSALRNDPFGVLNPNNIYNGWRTDFDDVQRYLRNVDRTAYGYFVQGPYEVFGEGFAIPAMNAGHSAAQYLLYADPANYLSDLRSALDNGGSSILQLIQADLDSVDSIWRSTIDFLAADNQTQRIRALLGGGQEALLDGFDFYLENPEEGGSAAFKVTLSIAGEAYLSGGTTSVAQARRLLAQLPSKIDGKAVRMTVTKMDTGETVLDRVGGRLVNTDRFRVPFTGSLQSKAIAAVNEASVASGLVGRDLFDKVVVRAGNSGFTVQKDGRRILYLNEGVVAQSNRGMLLREAAHELVHAEQYAKALSEAGGDVATAREAFLVSGRSYRYAVDEVVAEKLARRRIGSYLGNFSSETLRWSDEYLNEWRSIMRARRVLKGVE